MRTVWTAILVIFVLVFVAGLLYASTWVYFGPTYPRRDFLAEHTAHVLRSAGIRADEGRAGWEAYQRVLTLQREAYLRAFGEIRRDQEGNESLTLTFDVSDYNPEIDVQPVAPLLEAAEDVGLFEALDELARQKGFFRPKPSASNLELMLPEYGQTRNLARLLRFRILDPSLPEDARVAALRHALVLGMPPSQDGVILGTLVGIAMHASAARDAMLLAGRGQLSPESCKALAADLLRFSPPSASDVIHAEMLLSLGTIDATISESRFLPISRSAQMFKLDQRMSAGADWVMLPYVQRQSTAKPFEENLDSKRYPMVSLLLPAVGKAARAHDRGAVERLGSAVYLAVIAWSRTHGHPPDRLEQLVPDFLPCLPDDPFSGRPFGYRGEPQQGVATSPVFTLYSVGADGEDNDAQPSLPDPYSAFSETGRATDFIIAPRSP